VRAGEERGQSAVEEVRCPVCGKRFRANLERPRDEWPSFPFCSARCRALDLGKWLDEEYRISEPLLPPGGATDGEEKGGAFGAPPAN
jgi:endogenous inhibitor of DNA gyrase (YacG/DUF329 family)